MRESGLAEELARESQHDAIEGRRVGPAGGRGRPARDRSLVNQAFEHNYLHSEGDARVPQSMKGVPSGPGSANAGIALGTPPAAGQETKVLIGVKMLAHGGRCLGQDRAEWKGYQHQQRIHSTRVYLGAGRHQSRSYPYPTHSRYRPP